MWPLMSTVQRDKACVQERHSGSSAQHSLILQLCSTVDTVMRAAPVQGFTVRHPRECIRGFKSQGSRVCTSYSQTVHLASSAPGQESRRSPPSVRRQLLPSRRLGRAAQSPPHLALLFQAPGEPHLRRQPSHIGSVFTFGSHMRANTNDEK